MYTSSKISLLTFEKDKLIFYFCKLLGFEKYKVQETETKKRVKTKTKYTENSKNRHKEQKCAKILKNLTRSFRMNTENRIGAKT